MMFNRNAVSKITQEIQMLKKKRRERDKKDHAIDFIEKNVDQVPLFGGEKPIRFAPRKIDNRTAEERYEEAKETRDYIFYQN
jgi:hypothetical protein